MKSIDLLITSHLRQVLRPHRSPWFETDDEPTTELRTVRGLPTLPPRTVGETAGIMAIACLFIEHGVEAVVVVDANNVPCGIVCACDVLRARPDWTAADAMSSATVVRANASVEAVAEVMARERAPHVVIVEGDVVLGTASALEILVASRPEPIE